MQKKPLIDLFSCILRIKKDFQHTFVRQKSCSYIRIQACNHGLKIQWCWLHVATTPFQRVNISISVFFRQEENGKNFRLYGFFTSGFRTPGFFTSPLPWSRLRFWYSLQAPSGRSYSQSHSLPYPVPSHWLQECCNHTSCSGSDQHWHDLLS